MPEETERGYMRGGLDGRFVVSKAGGEPVSPTADYFPLRLDKDPHAKVAAIAYAKSVAQDNSILAWDLLRHVSLSDGGRPLVVAIRIVGDQLSRDLQVYLSRVPEAQRR